MNNRGIILLVQRFKSRNDVVVLLLFAAIGIVLYYSAFAGPWLLDDNHLILGNDGLRDLGNLFKNIFSQRGLSYLTLGLNVWLGDLVPHYFRLVNLALHVGTSLVVYKLLSRIFKGYLPLLGGLLFLVHPVQTQAVNYIVQRMTCQAVFFALTSLLFFSKGIDDLNSTCPSSYSKKAGYWLAATVCGMFAVLSKENTAVLPIMFFLWAKCISPATKFKHVLGYSIPVFIVVLLLALSHFNKPETKLTDNPGKAEFWMIDRVVPRINNAQGEKVFSGAHVRYLDVLPDSLELSQLYLATESIVVWRYVALFLLPLHQAVDHAYPLVDGVISAKVVFAASALFFCLFASLVVYKRYPLLTFAVVWFLLALVIESSIIPLDPLVEHRVYFCMFGLIVGTLYLLASIKPERIRIVASVALVLILSGLTCKRNAVWGDEIKLIRHDIDVAPHNHRNYLALSTAYAAIGNWSEAETSARTAILKHSRNPAAYENLGSALAMQGRHLEAVGYYQTARSLNPRSPGVLYNLGLALINLGRYDNVQDCLNLLKPLDPLLGADLEKSLLSARHTSGR
ncbi:tetratricopeptide repeat protein [Pelotalea chapellei]|uniref:Tetratricopeptide repeat protein n=1 Tax=Pelotalea chapellei TaxID=44671 RepID=A0ABS5UA56_9BACT|nr:tetratricopeptide repeat protein [Pelotalea chapellei]MBT1072566.1 tetratricopeptide repeat protein [Pelotalea chapellei]